MKYIFLVLDEKLVPDKVAQQVEELTTRRDDLSSIHRRREPVFRDVLWPLYGHSYLHPHTTKKWIKCSKNKQKQIPFLSTIKNSFQINMLNYQVWKAKNQRTTVWVQNMSFYAGFTRTQTHTHSFITLAFVLPWQSGVCATGPSVWASTPRIFSVWPIAKSMPACFTCAGQHLWFLRPQLVSHVTAHWRQLCLHKRRDEEHRLDQC